MDETRLAFSEMLRHVLLSTIAALFFALQKRMKFNELNKIIKKMWVDELDQL